MKKVTVPTALLLPLILFAQEKYIIKGKLGHLNAPAKIFLSYQTLPDYTEVEDSAILHNGKFEFKGSTRYPVEATMHLRRKGEGFYTNRGDEMRFLYIENGVITITGDSLPDAMVKGGIENNSYQQLQALLKPVKVREWQFDRQIQQPLSPEATRQKRS